MDPVRIIIFVAAFLLLIILGRKFSAAGESVPIPKQLRKENDIQPEDQEATNLPAVIGAELPFPIYLPALIRDPDGRYNRPEFYNYYFEKTDLLSGPADPATFYDYFHIEARDVESDHKLLYRYFVATPLGLQKALANNHIPALHLKQHAFIVTRWDLPLILETVIKHIIESYVEDPDAEANAIPDQDSLE